MHGYIAGVNNLDTSGYVAVIPAFQSVYFADGSAYDEWGYSKLDFVHTKITAGADGAFQIGEVVTQANSGAEGIYGECMDIKLTGTPSAAFIIGEVVEQANTGAKGYVAFSAADAIYVYPLTYTLDPALEFNTTEVVGATSGKKITPSAVSNWYDYSVAPTASKGAVGRYHYIYRTGTKEFDTTNVITGATLGKILTPVTAVAEIQTCTPNAQATSGTYTITYNGQTTAAIDYNATTTIIKTALEALSNVAENDIAVGGTIFSAGTGGLTLTFIATLGDVPMASVTSSMAGATIVTVTETTKGVAVVLAPPHWLPWIPVVGILPDGGSNIGCACFGRIFLNSMLNPHQWFCSRIFTPIDWDSSQTDVAAATYSQSAKAHEVGDVIVAMIPYKDHYLIWGCANEMWILQSDPLMGGINRCLSKTTGIFSPTSYCWDDKNNLYFLGTDGIYRLSAEAIINAQPPENITKQHIPKLITSLGLNRRTDRVAMAYDKQRYGIEVSVTQQDGQWSVCWWLDLRTGGLFPDVFPSLQSPASLFYYDSYKSSERGLLLGGYDGFIRKSDETEKSDEGSNKIESHFCIGPFVADGEPRNTVDMNEISLTTGEETDGITVDTHRADSADKVIADILDAETPAITKTLTGDGLKNSVRDKVSGRAVAIKIENTTADESFSIESINLNLKIAGRQK